MTPLGTNTQPAKQSNGSAPRIPIAVQNGTASTYSRQLELKGKVYKLMIQIDKIRAKPGPKCKKAALLAASRREKMMKIKEILNKHTKSTPQNDQNSLTDVPHEEASVAPEGCSQCPICLERVDSLFSLFAHHREKHFVCQLCEVPFASQVACDKHETLHQSNDTLLVYKCHLCPKTYDCTRNLKGHVKAAHWSAMDHAASRESPRVQELIEKLDYECGICKASFREEDTYRSHMVLHKMSVDNPILIPPEKISDMHLADQQNLKYTCTICTQTFYTPSAAEAHTCTSIELPGGKKICNVCQKVFETDELLNQHLANHLSRAYHCTVCRKAFINRATLNIHLKTHSSI